MGESFLSRCHKHLVKKSGRKIAYLFQERRRILDGTGTTLARRMEALSVAEQGTFWIQYFSS